MRGWFVKDFYQELVLDTTKIIISINFRPPAAVGPCQPRSGPYPAAPLRVDTGPSPHYAPLLVPRAM